MGLALVYAVALIFTPALAPGLDPGELMQMGGLGG